MARIMKLTLDTITINTNSKKGNLNKCENYRTICLISYEIKILLSIILNRLNPMVESILAEEKSGFMIVFDLRIFMMLVFRYVVLT